MPIQILGIDAVDTSSDAASMMNGRSLPWLQPRSDNDVWSLWGVTYRDVIIVGPDHHVITVFNLTTNSLSEPDNYAALLDLLADAGRSLGSGKPSK